MALQCVGKIFILVNRLLVVLGVNVQVLVVGGLHGWPL